MKKTIINVFVCLAFFTSQAQTTITIQPDSIQGKDAVIWTLANQSSSTWGATNVTNYGNLPHFHGMEWTWGGSIGSIKSLIDFDLSVVPQNSVITSAKLSLYGDINTSTNGHDPLSGSNACYLSKITSPWIENTVTWNTQPTISTLGQINLPQSTSAAQDYLDIDITLFMQDKYMNPSSNHGLMISMISPNHYRQLIFGSSDNLDPAKRPKLVVIYQPAVASLFENSDVIDFNLFPNPSNGQFTIQSVNDYTYKVYSITGQVIMSSENEISGSHNVDLSDSSAGIYLVEVSSNGRKNTKRIEIK